MSTFMQGVDVFNHLTPQSNQELVAKFNFFGIIGSTAMMTYFYRMSVSRDKLETVYGEDFAPRCSNYYRYASFGFGALVLYHFLLYPNYPLKQVEKHLGISQTFRLSKKQRYLIASCIAIPALIIEFFGWKEAKSRPLNPGGQHASNYKIFGGIYNYVRHPIYICEFSWFYTLSLLLNNPFCLVLSGIVIQPACYHICKSDEMDATHILGDEYREYARRTGFWIPKMFNGTT
eukprot:119097_1